MGDKKGKSLVMKLLDDLLEESSPSDKDDDQKKTESRLADDADGLTRPSKRAARDATAPVDLEISQVVKLPKDEVQPPASGNQIGSNKDDATMRLSESKISAVPNKLTDRFNTAPRPVTEPGEAKSAVGRFAPLRSGGFSSATEAALATSENLRIAQNRILELEQEISRLRTDNEQLAAAGETLRRRSDELATQTEHLQDRLKRTVEAKEQEIEILRQAQSQRDKDVAGLKMKIEELEMRLATNIQKIRVRERELENRLELVKMEGSALVRSKDEIILDLKRQLDQANLELENYRNKGQELNRQITDKQEMLRRAVKALRIALSMLEGEDEAAAKKVK